MPPGGKRSSSRARPVVTATASAEWPEASRCTSGKARRCSNVMPKLAPGPVTSEALHPSLRSSLRAPRSCISGGGGRVQHGGASCCAAGCWMEAVDYKPRSTTSAARRRPPPDARGGRCGALGSQRSSDESTSTTSSRLGVLFVRSTAMASWWSRRRGRRTRSCCGRRLDRMECRASVRCHPPGDGSRAGGGVKAGGRALTPPSSREGLPRSDDASV